MPLYAGFSEVSLALRAENEVSFARHVQPSILFVRRYTDYIYDHLEHFDNSRMRLEPNSGMIHRPIKRRQVPTM